MRIAGKHLTCPNIARIWLKQPSHFVFPQGWNTASLQREDRRRNPLLQAAAIPGLTPPSRRQLAGL
jgi:hypothetical protein